MQIGNLVKYSDQFLDDIGAAATPAGEPLAYAVGRIIEIDNGIANVQWDSARIPRHNAIKNLKIVGNIFHGSPIIAS